VGATPPRPAAAPSPLATTPAPAARARRPSVWALRQQTSVRSRSFDRPCITQLKTVSKRQCPGA
jgi:hypothetical protein